MNWNDGEFFGRVAMENEVANENDFVSQVAGSVEGFEKDARNGRMNGENLIVSFKTGCCGVGIVGAEGDMQERVMGCVTVRKSGETAGKKGRSAMLVSEMFGEILKELATEKESLEGVYIKDEVEFKDLDGYPMGGYLSRLFCITTGTSEGALELGGTESGGGMAGGGCECDSIAVSEIEALFR